MVLWGILTIVFYCVGLFAGTLISFLAIFHNSIDMARLEKDPKYNQQIAMEFSQAMLNNPIHSLAIMMCGFGGYLLVRYILNRKSDNMEKINLQ